MKWGSGLRVTSRAGGLGVLRVLAGRLPRRETRATTQRLAPSVLSVAGVVLLPQHQTENRKQPEDVRAKHGSGNYPPWRVAVV